MLEQSRPPYIWGKKRKTTHKSISFIHMKPKKSGSGEEGTERHNHLVSYRTKEHQGGKRKKIQGAQPSCSLTSCLGTGYRINNKQIIL